MKPHFILSKSALTNQVKLLEDLNLKISYSYKTNRQVGDILQEESQKVDFSLHAKEEIEMIKDKSKISFFTQAESIEELKQIITQGVTSFVIDNVIDLTNLLQAAKESKTKVNISLRMKFQEHRIGTGKYFVYGIPSKKVNELILKIKDNPSIENLGIHIHRKSQNTSEWEIAEEIQDSLTQETLQTIRSLNLGGGLPVKYISFTSKVQPYIFQKLTNAKTFLDKHNIETIIEPGRFLAAPCIKLKTKIIQVQNNNLILNTTIYNCALDNILTETKMLAEEEIPDTQEGQYYLIKGNSPTRDDIFRYKIKLNNPKVGDEITFINAGAYNYTTDFFGYKKLETKIIE
jgi:ornithine decarboxylase